MKPRPIGVLTLCLLVFFAGCATNVYPVYLTWQGDTSTTMTVNYHTPDAPVASTVFYDTESRDGLLSAYRYRAAGSAHQIPGLPGGRYINTVELSGLQPATAYYFIAGDLRNGFAPEKRFRTIPGDDAPLRFIAGGDMSVLPREKLLLKQAAKQQPMFAIIGGDIAYDNGDLDSYFLWDIWLKRWSRIMVNDDKTIVPLVLAIGNHEVTDNAPDDALEDSPGIAEATTTAAAPTANRRAGAAVPEVPGVPAVLDPPEARAPFYLGYFSQGGSSYFTRTFGANMLLMVLDSGHLVPQGGAQTAWLAEQSETYDGYPVKFAAYHVPLYPSVRDFDNDLSTASREHWLPLFDAHKLTAAFEHHDHAFKRTKPLRGGEVSEEGALYLGDGCFGVKPRPVTTPTPWYIEKSSNTPHFWVVDVSTEGISYRAIDSHGRIIDELSQPTAALRASAASTSP
ncbi:MAG: metallophosphoesterase family protein [Candidatus Hydrogenedentes bacterium]|nr:metallophosphoesterase family protein [Candidatus Hydrogenedentota bacterium]